MSALQRMLDAQSGAGVPGREEQRAGEGASGAGQGAGTAEDGRGGFSGGGGGRRLAWGGPAAKRPLQPAGRQQVEEPSGRGGQA